MPQLPRGLDLDGGIFRRLLADKMYEIQLMLTSGILVGYYLNPFSYKHILYRMTDNKGINHILQEDVVVEQNMVCITDSLHNNAIVSFS